MASVAGQSALQVLLIVGKARRNGGKRNREIAAVTGADANGAVGAGLWAGVDGCRVRGGVAAAEQVVQEIAGALLLLLLQGGGVLRAAIILRERQKNRTALVFAVAAAEAAAAQALEVSRDLVEVCAHLLNLIVHRAALRALAIEQREEARAVAAHPLGLRGDAIKLRLLPGGGILIAVDLLVLGRVAATAAVDHGQLRLKPRAHRIDGGTARGRRRIVVCAWASAPSSMATTSVAQATADLEGVTINFSGMSRRQGNSGLGLAAAP